MAGRFAVGARVDGLYDGNSDDVWYPGVIHAAHDDETFDVLYDDGEAEYHVRTQFLRAHKRGTICVGTRVFGRYASGDEWYPGKIQEALEDGTFTIEYDDGEVEIGLAMDRIRESMTDDAEVATPVNGGGEQAAQAEEEEVAATSGDITTEGEPSAQESEPVQAASDEPAGREEAASAEDERQQEAAEPVEKEENASVVASSHSHAVQDAESVPVAPRQVVVDPVPTPHEEQHELPPREAPARRKSKSKSQSPPTEASEEPANAMLDNAQSVDEYANILSTMEQLESSFADALTTKTLLSTLVKQMRAFPQATADLVHTRSGEALLIDILKRHHTHAVIQCYGFVLLRRLCFLCGKSTHYFLRNGIVELVTIAMRKFAEDAILQASACGALAVFTRVHAGLTALLENRVSHLVLATIIFHKTYSVHTRQVHYYACEVLLELCELGDMTTIEALCGDSMSGPGLSDLSPVSLLLFLLRQALSFDDKKACCAVGTLLMCLASCYRHAAQMVLDLNGLSELSTVMAKYPMEPGIQKYAASASREIAMCSMEQPSPTQRRVQNAAHDLLGESSSMEDLQHQRLQQHRQGTNTKSKAKSSTSTSKRKAPQQHGHGVSNLNGFPSPSHQQHLGAMAGNGRDALSFSKYTSPIGKAPHLPPNIRSFNGTSPSPSSLQYQQQQQHQLKYPQRNQVASPLVILDGLGHGGSEKKKFMKEERHNLLFETYGVDAKAALHQPPAGDHHVRTQGIKRRQLKTHIVAATGGDGGAISWALPVKAVILKETKPLTSRSDKQGVNTTTSVAAGSDSRKTRSSGGQASHHDGDSEELSPATLRRQQLQEKAKKREKESDDKTPRSSSFRLKLDSSNTTAAASTTDIVSPIAVSPRSGRSGAGATKSTTKAKKTGRQPAPVSSRLSGGEKTASNESLTSYAAQLFKDEMQAPAVSPTANAAAIKAAQERERLSFAEKLHKMIDKAKSSLAHGSTVSLVADSPVKASTKRPNNGNSASIKKKQAPTPTASTSRVVPTSSKPVASVSTPNKDATATQKRPMAASVKPAPQKKPVTVVASTPVAKPATPSTKPIVPVPPKATTTDGVAPSRPAPAANKSGSASVRPKPTSASSKAPASTTKSTTEKKAEKKASGSSAAAAAAAVTMAGAAVLATAAAAAIILTADEKEAESTSAVAETKEEEIPLSKSADEDILLSPEQGGQADESKAEEVLTAGDEVHQESTEAPVEIAGKAASAEAVAEDSSALPVEDAVSVQNTSSDQPAETQEEANTPPEEKTAEATVAEAAVVVAAASAADDLYADEYNDFDDLDGGDNAPQTLDDDGMGRDTSFETLMNLTAQVTGQEDESGIPQFSVAAPVPAAVVEEANAPVEEVIAADAESGVADTQAETVTDSPPGAEEDAVSMQEPTATDGRDAVEAVEADDAITGAETAEPEPMTSRKYDHAEEVGGVEEDEREQPDDASPASESEPTTSSESAETSTSSDEQPSTSEEAAPVAASDDNSSSVDEASAVEPATLNEPEQDTGDSSAAEESASSSGTQEEVRAETPSREERPESRQTDVSYGEEDFEDTPEDAGDETLPNATEEETPSLFEPAEVSPFEPATEKQPVAESAAEPVQADEAEQSQPVEEQPVDAASEEAEAVTVVEQAEMELGKDEIPSSAVDDAVIADTTTESAEEAAAMDVAQAADPILADEQVVAPEGDQVQYDDESFSNLETSQAREESCAAPEAALEIPTNGNAASDAPELTTETEADTMETTTAVIEDAATTAEQEQDEEATTTEQQPKTEANTRTNEAEAATNEEVSDKAAAPVEPTEVTEASLVDDAVEATPCDEPSSSDPVAPSEEVASEPPPDKIESPSEEPRAATPDVSSAAEFASEEVGDSANRASARDPEPVEGAEELREVPPPDVETVAPPSEEDRAATPDVYSETDFGGDEAVPGEQEHASEDTGSTEASPVAEPVEDAAPLDVESKPSRVDEAVTSRELQEETTSERVPTPDAYAQDEEFEDEPPMEEAREANTMPQEIKDTDTTPQEPPLTEPEAGEVVADEPPADAPLSDAAPPQESPSAEPAADDASEDSATVANDGDADSSPQATDQGEGDVETVVSGDDVVPVSDESAVEVSSLEEQPKPQSADEDATPPVDSEPEQPSDNATAAVQPPVETEAVEQRAATPDGYADAEFAEYETYAAPDVIYEDKVDDTAAEQPHEDLASGEGPEPMETQATATESELPAERAATPEAYGDDGDFEEQVDAIETHEDAVDSDPPSDGTEAVSVVDQVEVERAPAESHVADEESNGVQAELDGVGEQAEAVEAVDASAAGDESAGPRELTPDEHEPQADEPAEAVVDEIPATPEEENLYEDDTAFGDDGDHAEPPQPATESAETSADAASTPETEAAELPSPMTEEEAVAEPLAIAAEEVDVTNATVADEPSVEEQHDDNSKPSSDELVVESSEPSANEIVQVETTEPAADELHSEATEPPVEAVSDEVSEPAADELHEAKTESAQDEEPPQSVAPESSEEAADPVPEPTAELAAAPKDTPDEAYADEYAFDEEAAAPASAATDVEVAANPQTSETVKEATVPLAEETPLPVEEATEETSTQVEEKSQELVDSEEPAVTENEKPAEEAIEIDEPTDVAADKIKVSGEELSAANETPQPTEVTEEAQSAPVEEPPAESEPLEASSHDDGVTLASLDDDAILQSSAIDPNNEPPASTEVVDGEAEQPQSTLETPRREDTEDEVGVEKREDAADVSSEKHDESPAYGVTEEEAMDRESVKDAEQEQEEEAVTTPESTEKLPSNEEPSTSPEMVVEQQADESQEPAKTDDTADEYAFDDDAPVDQAAPQEEVEKARESVVDTEKTPPTDEAVEVGAQVTEVTEATDDAAYNDEDNEFEEPKVDTPELVTSADPSPISSSAPSPPPSDEVDYEDFESDEPVATASASASSVQPVKVKPTASEATEDAYADETEDYNDFEEDAVVTEAKVAAPVASAKKEDEEVEVDDVYEAEEGFEDDDDDAKTTFPPRIQPPVITTVATKPSVAAEAVKASSPSTPTAEEDADNDYEAEYDEFED